MRILIITFPASGSAIGGEEQIALALKAGFAGHEVDICTRDNQGLLQTNTYDLVLSLSHPVDILSKKGAIWLTWVFNENLGSTFDSILSNNFDGFLTNSKRFSEAEYLPFPSFDYYARTEPLSQDQKYDVMYLGNYNPEYKECRIEDFLLPCMKYNFAIYGGAKWKILEQKRLYSEGKFDPHFFAEIYDPYYQGIFPLSECPRISDYAKIFVNFNSPGQASLGMVSNRIYDLLANGCFIITDDTPEQRAEFGDTVEYSTGGADLEEKIGYYLAHPGECLKKQELALARPRMSYADAATKILEFYSKVKASPVQNGKTWFLVVVDNVELLDGFLKRLPGVNAVFYVPKCCRIKALGVIEEHRFTKDSVEVIEGGVYSFKLDISRFSKNDVLIPTYSSVMYPPEFLPGLTKALQDHENVDIFRFKVLSAVGLSSGSYSKEDSVSLHLPYGFYAVRKRNVPALDWSLLKTKRAKVLGIDLHQHFDTQKERSLYLQESLKYSLVPEVPKVQATVKPQGKIENLRYSVFTKKPEVGYDNVQLIGSSENPEKTIRGLRSHYTVINFQAIDWSRLNPIVASRLNYDLFILGSTLIVKTGLLYGLKPAKTLKDLFDTIASDKSLSTLYINPLTYDLRVVKAPEFKPKASGLKVAVMSMCGVSSYEDKYGIGGEHQVVHWLKEAFEKRDGVHYCHIFDTFNYDLLDPDEYDIVFSNSCWRSVAFKRKRKDNLTIFWHFNDDSGKATMDTVERMAYDYVWTNSYIGFDWLKEKGLKCNFKQLNASSKWHHPYPYDSALYREADCVYVGGYQAHYKGKEMIDTFIKPLVGQDFRFSIYGNRLWQSDVQKQALETDNYFRPEFYDASFDSSYRGILPMQDFAILAKNVPVWVNFNAITQRALQMNNDRVIWGLACGAFFITDDTPEARRFYGSSGPVVFSTGGKDLVDKVRYYLAHPIERLGIAGRGPEFVQRNKLYTEDTVEQIVDLWKSHTASR